MASLAEIRAKLESMENKSSGNTKPANNDTAIYPFWNIEEGQSATMRFLPDSDPNNTFFWVERQVIKLTFPGVAGGENKPVTVQVPCGEMYGDTCPVLTEVRPWFKDPSLEDMGRKYWKKRSYIFQGFVTENPMEEEVPENPIRRFIIGPQIFNIIKSALMDPDMENIPTDYVNGTDFRLAKTSKGQYADYGTSKWARRERSLDETELAAIDQHGLYNLNDFLPARPSAQHYEVIAEMFEASVNGELYDPVRWGNFYKPYGVEVPANATPAPGQTGLQATTAPVAAPQAAPAPAPVVETVPEPAPVAEAPAPAAEPAPAADTGKQSADDILAMIRQRQSS
jgi:hypothetical protein